MDKYKVIINSELMSPDQEATWLSSEYSEGWEFIAKDDNRWYFRRLKESE